MLNRSHGLGGGENLNGDLHGSAAYQSVIPSKILIEAKAKQATLVFGHKPLGPSADFGFDTAASKGADGVTIAQDQHGRALVLRRAAPRANHGAQGDDFTELGSADDLRKEINHNKNGKDMNNAAWIDYST